MIAQKRFASKRTKKRARCSSFYTRRLGSFSLARARERFPSSPNGPFFSHVWIFVSFKVGYAKSEFREKRARALWKSGEIFSRERLLRRRRRKRSYLNLGGLEAGDGRDLLSSSKHYVYRVDVFLCVWMTIFSRASNICISRITVLVKKRPSEDGTWGRRILSFFEKRGRWKRDLFSKVSEDGYLKEIREKSVFYEIWKSRPGKVFQESAKKKTKDPHTRTRLYDFK